MKRGLIFILALLLFMQIYFVSAFVIVTQPASSIIINVDGTSRNLDAGASYFIGTHSFSIASLTAGQHDASQVWVSVKDGEMTLSQALQSTDKLCPNPSSPTTYYSSPADKSKPYHLATEIIFSSGNLQSAINAGTFCGCIPGATRAISCSSLSTTCTTYVSSVTSTCQSSGAWDNPSCTIASYAAKGTGTNCNSDDWHACDGAGTCAGLDAIGCGSCPAGTEDGPYRLRMCVIPSGWVGRWWTVNSVWSPWSTTNQLFSPWGGARCDLTTWIDPYTGDVTNYYHWQMKPNT
jgi:hypothetical protein